MHPTCMGSAVTIMVLGLAPWESRCMIRQPVDALNIALKERLEDGR